MIIYETDSRKVKTGQIFVAIEGHTVDGHNYIEDAIKNGAIKVVGTKDITCSVPYEKVTDSEKYLTEHIYDEYKDEIKDIDFIGVTGTNGKTTTCYLTYQILELLGYDVAYMGTIGFFYKKEHIVLSNTTPDILAFYNLVINAKNNGCKTIVMEVSSHALDMNRILGVNMKVAGFTNLTQDHLDYHGDMDNYLNAKLKILNYLDKNSKFITNIDDFRGIEFKNSYENTLTYGENNADYHIKSFTIDPDKTKITFEYQKATYEVTTNLTSEFNVYNYVLALALINNYGMPIEKIIEITDKIKPPKGRCETYKINDAFAVIDYAHTPDAVEKIISAYTKLKQEHAKLITIVGCGGDRDAKKRPIMGEIACNLSDYVIFTSDNPRTENPDNILDDIIKGVKKDNYEVIVDRIDAIDKGISMLESDDILLILGKGHEDYQIIGHTKIHLDDAEQVLKHIN